MDNRNQADTPNFIRGMQSRWLPEAGAHANDLCQLAHWAKATIPEDFLRFLRWSNGGRCVFPHVYVDLWSIANIIELDDRYHIRRYLGDSFMGIGTDGGPTLISLNLRGHGKVTSFDLGDLDVAQGKPVAGSFVEILRRFDSGLLTSDNLFP